MLRPGNMLAMPEQFQNPLSDYESTLCLPAGFTTRPNGSVDPHADAAIEWLEYQRPRRQSFWPALCLAFIGQAEAVLKATERPRVDNPFVSVVRKSTSANRAIDQLVWLVGEIEFSTRPYYNAAERVIIGDMHREHPSAAAHATSKWEMYRQFIEEMFSALPSGRLKIANWIWETGVLAQPLTISTASRTRQPRPFLEMLKHLDRGSGRTGGAIFQALVYAYLYADSPTLTVISQRVNTGSRRAGVVGDVSGYLGEHVVLAAEAKDKDLDGGDISELTTFINESSAFPDMDAVVFARSFDPALEDHLNSVQVRTFPLDLMIRTVSLWDVPKQENAVRAVRFFLGQIQRSAALIERVDLFLQSLVDVAKSDGEEVIGGSGE